MNYTTELYQSKAGIELLLVDIPSTSVFASRIIMKAGSSLICDYQKKEQLAHVLEHMFSHPVGYKTKRDYAVDFEKFGAYKNAHTGRYYMVHVADCSMREWRRVFELQMRLLGDITLDQRTLDNEIGNAQIEYKSYLNNQGWRLTRNMEVAVGLKSIDVPESIETFNNITLNDIKDFWQKYCVAENTRIVVLGNLDKIRDDVKEIVDRLDMTHGDVVKFPQEELHNGGSIAIKLPNARLLGRLSMGVQRHLSVDECYAMSGLATYITRGLSSRIYGAAREKGLSYGMVSGINYTLPDKTIYSLTMSTTADKLDELAELISGDIKKICGGDLTDGDIDTIKQRMLGEMDLRYQSIDSITNLVAGRYEDLGEIISCDEVYRAIDQITRGRILDLINEFYDSDVKFFGLCGDTTKADAENAYSILTRRNLNTI